MHSAVGIRERVLRSESGNLSIAMGGSLLGICFSLKVETFSLPGR